MFKIQQDFRTSYKYTLSALYQCQQEKSISILHMTPFYLCINYYRNREKVCVLMTSQFLVCVRYLVGSEP